MPTQKIVERRHEDLIKFLFLAKLGLLGSQVVLEQIAGCELCSTFDGWFFLFSWANIIFFYIVEFALKSCLIQKRKKKFGKYFGGGLKIGFF
jgi:hypothetical protein